MAASNAISTGITLKGSVKTCDLRRPNQRLFLVALPAPNPNWFIGGSVAEFFEYSINNILYQREIYPPETFRRVAKYGLAMFVTTDEGLTGYLSNVLAQLEGAQACLPSPTAHHAR